MKKLLSLITVGVLAFSIIGCGLLDSEIVDDEPSGMASLEETVQRAHYESPADVTLEDITEMSSARKMLEYKGGVELEFIYEGSGDANLDGGKTYARYLKDGDIIHANQIAEYPGDMFTHLYFSNDVNDQYLYMQSNAGAEKSPFSNESANAIIDDKIYGLDTLDSKLISVTEDGANYIAKIEVYSDERKNFDVTLVIDPMSGYVLESETIYYGDDNVTSKQLIKANYSSDIEINFRPKTAVSEEEEYSASTGMENFAFSTVDIDGNPVTEEVLKGAKLVMINFWEPWCGPCVGEMPDLEKLYEEYKDRGFIILGVFSTTGMDDDAREIMKDCKTSYPVVRTDKNLEQFMTDYFPTTVFMDAEGNLLSDEPLIGADSYKNWKTIIENYLEMVE